MINIISSKLPLLYQKAFSLQFVKKCDNFATASVSDLLWLGLNIDINMIKQAFPFDKIISREGDAYLVYKSGDVEQI